MTLFTKHGIAFSMISLTFLDIGSSDSIDIHLKIKIKNVMDSKFCFQELFTMWVREVILKLKIN